MRVNKVSFSAHADNKGIVRLIKHLNPQYLIFVHGDKKRMTELGQWVTENLRIETHCPKNFEVLRLTVEPGKTVILEGDDSQLNSIEPYETSHT